MKTEKIEEIKVDMSQIERMFGVGAHYAYTKTRRHPSVKKFIFGTKNGTEIFDLEKTYISLEEAKEFIRKILVNEENKILFVASKSEAKNVVKPIVESLDMPVVFNRWVGGTLTNFEMIKKRVERYLKLIDDREKGELLKYTKKERGQIDKEIEKLEKKFLGIASMKKLPVALFVVDSRHESVAIEEARSKNIPIIALVNSDCDIKKIDYPILANDTSGDSIKFFTEEIAKVCKIKKETK